MLYLIETSNHFQLKKRIGPNQMGCNLENRQIKATIKKLKRKDESYLIKGNVGLL